jgi:hypothetical protein
LQVQDGKAIIRDSHIAGRNSASIDIDNPGVELTVDNCNISKNAFGISSRFDAIVRASGTTITGNNTGLSATAGGAILSRTPASNTVEGNGTAGAFTGTYAAQ